MGGSGGSSYTGRSDPEKLRRQLRQAEEETEDHEYEAEVADLLGSLLTEFNDRDVEAIDGHLEQIREALEKEIDGTLDLNFGGSVAKHTYVDGLSDVDALVLVEETELADQAPDEAKEYIATRLRERFPKHDIESGTLAVTVYFADAEIQLLPASRVEDQYRIPDSSGETWSRIDPRAFAQKLTEVNQKNARKVVPTVKLAKGIVATLPKPQRISGYHAESLAIEVFEDYEGPFKLKDMLGKYFNDGAERLMSPITDSSGQSLYVDEYLGDADSLERRRVSDAFSRIARRMRNADRARSISEWSSFFDLEL